MEQQQILITSNSIGVTFDSKVILNNLSFQIKKGEVLAIIGPSGSGKTTLGNVISGSIKPTSGKLNINGVQNKIFVGQQDNYASISKQKSAYYGQRYEYQETENIPTVLEYLSNLTVNKNDINEVITELNLKNISNNKLLQLSNGERKRTQLATAILKKPDVLILDQPFIGLDTNSKSILKKIINTLKSKGTTLIIICDDHQIHEDVDWVLELSDGNMKQFISRDKYLVKTNEEIPFVKKIIPKQISLQPKKKFDTIVSLKDVHVTLGGKEILKNINWIVKENEKWCLLGHNGAGKTTLLSLITADNPQAYKNDIILFDRKRGTGESIWDIKKQIGYVSPELHLYFLKGKGIFNSVPGMKGNHSSYNSLTCLNVVASGFNDEIGLPSLISKIQESIVKEWFSLLNLDHLINQLYNKTSLGEQRMLLLARALIKSPPLLVLDEPCQGLDTHQTKYFIGLLGEIKKHVDFALIYVSHNSHEIPNWIHNKLELKNGKKLIN